MAEKTPEQLQAEIDALTKERDEARESEAKWKALSRKHEDNAKGNADAAAKAKEAQEAAKTAEERIAALEQRTTAAERDAMIARVQRSKNLSDSQAKRLVGATLEELEADADELLASFKRAPDGASGEEGNTEPDKGSEGDKSTSDTPRSRPKEKLRSGAASGGGGEEPSVSEVIAAIPRP